MEQRERAELCDMNINIYVSGVRNKCVSLGTSENKRDPELKTSLWKMDWVAAHYTRSNLEIVLCHLKAQGHCALSRAASQRGQIATPADLDERSKEVVRRTHSASHQRPL